MNYFLIIRPEAEADLSEAKEWYERQREGLGLDFVLAVEDAFARIRRMPLLHAEIYKRVRRTATRRFPYGIYYRFVEDTVVVVAVMHSRRDPRRWQERADQLGGMP